MGRPCGRGPRGAVLSASTWKPGDQCDRGSVGPEPEGRHQEANRPNPPLCRRQPWAQVPLRGSLLLSLGEATVGSRSMVREVSPKVLLQPVRGEHWRQGPGSLRTDDGPLRIHGYMVSGMSLPMSLLDGTVLALQEGSASSPPSPATV